MTEILVVAMVVTLATSLVIAIRWGHTVCEGPLSVGLFTFIAILFTSGLDVGLIMFPLVDFEVYASEAAYGFANPLAIEFGFWGFLVWGFYFLTTFYFCIVEPKLKLFEIPAIRLTTARGTSPGLRRNRRWSAQIVQPTKVTNRNSAGADPNASLPA